MVTFFAVMIKSYHVNKILEPSYLRIFPWVQASGRCGNLVFILNLLTQEVINMPMNWIVACLHSSHMSQVKLP